jgi:hypothetical protein
VPYKTRLDMRRALVRCYDYFEEAAEWVGDGLRGRSKTLDELRDVCFEALDRPSAADLKSLREGAGGGRA